MFLTDNNRAEDVALDEQSEAVLMGVAQEIGLLVTTEEADSLNRFMERAEKEGGAALTEAQNIVKLNTQAKLTNLTVRSALVIARAKKDPLFAKYAKASALKRQLREQIMAKYAGQARTTARRILANAGRKNMVDVSSTKAFGHPNSTV